MKEVLLAFYNASNTPTQDLANAATEYNVVAVPIGSSLSNSEALIKKLTKEFNAPFAVSTLYIGPDPRPQAISNIVHDIGNAGFRVHDLNLKTRAELLPALGLASC